MDWFHPESWKSEIMNWKLGHIEKKWLTKVLLNDLLAILHRKVLRGNVTYMTNINYPSSSKRMLTLKITEGWPIILYALIGFYTRLFNCTAYIESIFSLGLFPLERVWS